MTDTYSVHVRCTNCGWYGRLDIPRSTRVRGTPCPTCNCYQLDCVLAKAKLADVLRLTGKQHTRDKCACRREQGDTIPIDAPVVPPDCWCAGGDVGK